MVARNFLWAMVLFFMALFVAQGVWAERPDHAGNAKGIGGLPDSASPDDVGYSEIGGHGASCLKPGARSGLIKTNRQVLYRGDSLELEIVLPHSLRAFWSGDADAHVVFGDPDGNLFYGTVNAEALDSKNPRMSLIIEGPDLELPEGNYQVAIILTVPGGDPLELTEWYDGFQGLVAVSRIRIAGEGDQEDLDGDGTVDGDEDGDGYTDEEENS